MGRTTASAAEARTDMTPIVGPWHLGVQRIDMI